MTRCYVVLLLVLQQSLMVAAVESCYDGCFCLAGLMTCSSVDRIPRSTVPDSIVEIDMSNNQFSSPTLRRENFTQLAVSMVNMLSMRGCGINAIEHNTFIGE